VLQGCDCDGCLAPNTREHVTLGVVCYALLAPTATSAGQQLGDCSGDPT
jgi:hypothetical protein